MFLLIMMVIFIASVVFLFVSKTKRNTNANHARCSSLARE